jgi:hypothetical protein
MSSVTAEIKVHSTLIVLMLSHLWVEVEIIQKSLLSDNNNFSQSLIARFLYFVVWMFSIFKKV